MAAGVGLGGFRSDEQHDSRRAAIRVAVGRDYADVPPTRGVFKGDGDSELERRGAGIPGRHRAARTAADPGVQSWSPGSAEDWDWAQAQSAQQQ